MGDPSTPTGDTRGLVMVVGSARMFLPAAVALKIAHLPPITRVPGAPPELVGIALFEGSVVPVIAIGERKETMVVCSFAGEKVGLVGGEVVETGICDVAGARLVDLAPTLARIQAGGWSAAWRG